MQLVASGLHCDRGGREVLAGLGFKVECGQALAVTGRNGAGKSSLLRVVAGLLRLTQGSIALHGGEPELTLAEQCHYLGHLDALKPTLTLAENLQFWAKFLGGGAGKTTEEALAVVGLAELADLSAGYLSAGQQRRLSLARLAAIRRPIWLLDEPTSTLDTAGQARFGEMVREHLAGGGMAIVATHAPLGVESADELRLGGGA